MNIGRTLVLVWILFSAVLIIGNMTQQLSAYIFWWHSKTWLLSIVSIITWIMIWYGIRLPSMSDKDNDDDFDF